MGGTMERIPGTSDLWEPELIDWVELEATARRVFRCYGYEELRVPVFERTEVFVHAIGDETDVVCKEMYTFEDRGGRSLTLRPEGTAGVLRAIANRGLSQGEQCQVFYMGPMFRGERPAAGRRRQFHQIGAEAVGRCAAAEDVECIAMLLHYLEEIGISNARLLLNTRGVEQDRETVSTAFRQYFEPRIESMCEDCRRRLATNVWRILDCKQGQCQAAVEKAPCMAELICEESREFFTAVCKGLDGIGVSYELAPRLVRGLDYYVHTVFEVVHGGLGAQDAIVGGGRYRVSVPGSKTVLDGVGFATGVERLLMARASNGLEPQHMPAPDAYIVSLGTQAMIPGLVLARELRRAGVRVMVETQGRSMKAQMRTASKLGVRFVLIQGEAELQHGVVVCKNMGTSEQQEIHRADLLTEMLAKVNTSSSNA